MSLIGYSSSAGVVFNFKAPQNVNDVKRRIDGLTRQAGYRRPDEALKLASSDLFTPAGGARDGARRVNNIKKIYFSFNWNTGFSNYRILNLIFALKAYKGTMYLNLTGADNIELDC